MADTVAAAVRDIDGVAELHGGLFGEVGTYLPGRRVLGVRLDVVGNAEIHVVLRWGFSIPATADAVRRRVWGLVPGVVDVVVDDVTQRWEPSGGRRSEEGVT
ncbi:Asp23/Gls24 family envelope stress response protein [Jiangella asiatica]|nr:Asp23/Gls24 family envelope stress response protein [Jiangella asiatica]